MSKRFIPATEDWDSFLKRLGDYLGRTQVAPVRLGAVLQGEGSGFLLSRVIVLEAA